jgi:hypothetical protein
MKRIQVLLILTFALIVSSCTEPKQLSSIAIENWDDREAQKSMLDSLEFGHSYLSVYSQIYSLSEHRQHDLTATISIRNTSIDDSIFILNAEYYNTQGDLLRSYFDHPIYLAPLETVEIVIDEGDREGGTGANFLFDWKIKHDSNEPLFEAVMISTSGQQGLSFTTNGIRTK